MLICCLRAKFPHPLNHYEVLLSLFNEKKWKFSRTSKIPGPLKKLRLDDTTISRTTNSTSSTFVPSIKFGNSIQSKIVNLLLYLKLKILYLICMQKTYIIFLYCSKCLWNFRFRSMKYKLNACDASLSEIDKFYRLGRFVENFH